MKRLKLIASIEADVTRLPEGMDVAKLVRDALTRDGMWVCDDNGTDWLLRVEASCEVNDDQHNINAEGQP